MTTNYVLVETYTLAQRRLGQAAVRVLADDMLPMAEVEFVGRDAHDRAVAALIAANRRDLSLVDAVSFDVMRRRGISRAFTSTAISRRPGSTRPARSRAVSG